MNNQKKREDGMPKVRLNNTIAQNEDQKLDQEEIQESNDMFFANDIFFQDQQKHEPNQPNEPILISQIPQKQGLTEKAQNNQQSLQRPSSSIIERNFNKRGQENNLIQQQIQKHSFNTLNHTHHETQLLEQDYNKLKRGDLVPDVYHIKNKTIEHSRLYWQELKLEFTDVLFTVPWFVKLGPGYYQTLPTNLYNERRHVSFIYSNILEFKVQALLEYDICDIQLFQDKDMINNNFSIQHDIRLKLLQQLNDAFQNKYILQEQLNKLKENRARNHSAQQKTNLNHKLVIHQINDQINKEYIESVYLKDQLKTLKNDYDVQKTKLRKSEQIIAELKKADYQEQRKILYDIKNGQKYNLESLKKQIQDKKDEYNQLLEEMIQLKKINERQVNQNNQGSVQDLNNQFDFEKLRKENKQYQEEIKKLNKRFLEESIRLQSAQRHIYQLCEVISREIQLKKEIQEKITEYPIRDKNQIRIINQKKIRNHEINASQESDSSQSDYSEESDNSDEKQAQFDNFRLKQNPEEKDHHEFVKKFITIEDQDDQDSKQLLNLMLQKNSNAHIGNSNNQIMPQLQDSIQQKNNNINQTQFNKLNTQVPYSFSPTQAQQIQQNNHQQNQFNSNIVIDTNSQRQQKNESIIKSIREPQRQYQEQQKSQQQQTKQVFRAPIQIQQEKWLQKEKQSQKCSSGNKKNDQQQEQNQSKDQTHQQDSSNESDISEQQEQYRIHKERKSKGLAQLTTENIDFNDPVSYSLCLFTRFKGLDYCKRKNGLHIIKYTNLAKIKRLYFQLFGFNLMYLVIFNKDEELQIVFYKLQHEQSLKFKKVQKKFDQEMIIVQQSTTLGMLKSIEKNCKVQFNRQKHIFWKANDYTIDKVKSDLKSYRSQILAIRFRNVIKMDEFLEQLTSIKNFSRIITKNTPKNILISNYLNGQEIIVIISFEKIQEFNFLDYFTCFPSYYDIRFTNDLIDNKKLKQIITKYHWSHQADFKIQDLEWLTHNKLEQAIDQLNTRDIPQFEDIFAKIDLQAQP